MEPMAQPPVPQPVPQLEKTPGPSWTTLAVVFLIAVVLAGGYLAAAKRASLWPYEISMPSETPTPGQQTKTYTDPTYGFTLDYPASWHAETCKDTGPGGTYLLLALGDAPQLVICNSDAPFEGIVQMAVAPGGSMSEQEQAAIMADLDSPVRSPMTIDAVRGVRIEGITRQTDGHSPGPGKKYILIFASRNNVLYRWLFIQDAAKLPLFDEVMRMFRFNTPSSSTPR